MKKLLNHIKRWNRWRRYNTNAWWYKILVLLGVCRSPTLIYFDDADDLLDLIFRGATIDAMTMTSDEIIIFDGKKLGTRAKILPEMFDKINKRRAHF